MRLVLELIYFSNGVCDANCNKFECLWDNHDCDDIEPKWPKYRDGRESYHQSVDFTQLVLDRKFETKVTNRTWNPHMPFMLDKRILEDISTELPIETSLTRYASGPKNSCAEMSQSFRSLKTVVLIVFSAPELV